MRYLSLCSGIEAATVAWHPMGWEPAAFAEIEAFPAAVLRHHYPHTPNLGDMTKWREWDVGSVDLLVGGTPCQSFSVAGLRKGLSDPRGGLMLTFLEIAQSLRPRWVVWENVPGVLSSGGGRDFGSFLGALGELGYGWAYRVLDAQWCRVDGYERAVPQRRRRVFVVGCLADATSAAKVLFERQSAERNPAPRGKARQGAAADAEDGARAGGCYWDGSDCAATLTKQNAGGGQRMPDKANFGAVLQPAWPAEVAPTLTQAGKGTGAPGFSNQEIFSQGCASLVPDTHAIAFEPRYYTRDNKTGGAPQDVPSLRADASKVGDTSPCVAFTPGNLSRGAGPSPNFEVAPTHRCSAGRGADDQRTCVAFTCKDYVADAGDVAPTLRTMPHDGSHANGGGQVAIAFHPTQDPISSTDGTTHALGCGSKQGTAKVTVAFKPSHFTRGKDGSPADITPPLSADADKGDQDTVVAYPIDGRNAMRDPSHTVTSACVHAVGFSHSASSTSHGVAFMVEGSPPIRGGGAGNSMPAVATQTVAPSLTASNDPSRSPQSAEVTQQIAAVHQATMVVRRLTPVECERLQGFPDDYTNIPWRGKPESPDGPRYKALGNSMAVNCMRWIGRRIDAVDNGTELPQ